MEIKVITSLDSEWEKVTSYAGECSWRAGKNLSTLMKKERFTEWERVLVAIENDEIAGYCTVSKTDCIPNVEYTPYIGFMFVGEAYRGRRLSQELIQNAIKYLKELGFEQVYLVSDHINLYEKYGFCVIDRKIAPWGEEEKIYMQKI